MRSQTDILTEIDSREALCLGPVRLVRGGGGEAWAGQDRADSVVARFFSLEQANRQYEFVGKIATLGTPKMVQAVADEVMRRVESIRQSIGESQVIRVPLVIAPFLSEQRLTELADQNVSGIDLCGNGVLTAEGLYVFKSGQKNRYPRSTRLQNAYRAKSSLVGRALLMRPEFDTVGALVEFINTRGPSADGRRDASISFSQVSKALKQMEQDVIVSRKGGRVRLLQADSLLDALVRDYQPPRIQERWLGYCSEEASVALQAKVRTGLDDPRMRYAVFGVWAEGPALAYLGEPVYTLYTDARPRCALADLPGEAEQGRRFANVEILTTQSDWVYFGRGQYGGAGVSDVQTYLQFANGDTRQKQGAQQLRGRILASLTGAGMLP